MNTATRPLSVLIVCTANQCRSPMAAVALRHRVAARGADVTVASAGLLPGGAPATAHAATVMAERGLDLSGHRSRQLSAEMIAQADLVLAMSREHLREVVVREPSAFARTFTLKELARRASGLPRRDHEPVVAWLDRVGAGRRRDALMGSAAGDDVADPIGGSIDDYRRTRDEIEALLDAVMAMLRPEQSATGQT